MWKNFSVRVLVVWNSWECKVLPKNHKNITELWKMNPPVCLMRWNKQIVDTTLLHRITGTVVSIESRGLSIGLRAHNGQCHFSCWIQSAICFHSNKDSPLTKRGFRWLCMSFCVILFEILSEYFWNSLQVWKWNRKDETDMDDNSSFAY